MTLFVPQFRHGQALFCDDVRLEVGNKLSYMGLYRGDMILGDPLPVVLAKFVVVVYYSEPATDPPEALKIKIYLPGQEDSDPSVVMEIPKTDAERADAIHDLPLEKQVRQAIVPISFAPLVLKEPGDIRVHVQRGDEVYRIGTLVIRAPAGDASTANENDADAQPS